MNRGSEDADRSSVVKKQRIVASYNAEVFKIAERIPDGRIGAVLIKPNVSEILAVRPEFQP
jgi:hypothetical protein